jgi:SAM-dependent methyltransferase
MGFDVPGDRYDRFMGRFTVGLAPLMADAAHVERGMRVVDVGCGPGGLTVELAARVGGDRVAAIDPSPPFVAACRERVPGADVREGGGESLPWDDHAFDAALSCLVVGFMRDPAAGVAEMRRVTRPGGLVAICFWHVPRHQMLDLAARAITSVRPDADPHPPFVGTEQGDLRGLLEGAGMDVVADGEMTVAAPYDDFGDFWASVSDGAGPIADAMVTMTPDERAAAEAYARAELPDGAFSLTATAWYAVGLA